MTESLLTADMLNVILTGMPNFVGFLVLAIVMWKIITRQLDILEKLVDDCLNEQHYRDTDKLSQPPG